LAEKNDVKTVATNDAHYVLQEDWEAHDQLLCIQTAAKVSDTNRFRMNTRQLYIKSREEMERMFGDHPECLDHSQLIADKCDFTLHYGENHFPVFRRLTSGALPQTPLSSSPNAETPNSLEPTAVSQKARPAQSAGQATSLPDPCRDRAFLNATRLRRGVWRSL
jgi:DNA polymerase III alpha subunit